MRTALIGSGRPAPCHLKDMESLQGPGLSKKTKTVLTIVLIYGLAFFLATISF